MDSFLSSLRALSLTEYASYNVSDAELASFGLDEPALTIMIDPGGDGGEGEEAPGSFLLHLSQDPEEEAAYEEAVENGEDELPAVTCYARLGQSQIVYEISPSAYEKLTAVSFDTLRHQKLFTADFDTAESLTSLSAARAIPSSAPRRRTAAERIRSGHTTARNLTYTISKRRSARSRSPASRTKHPPVRRRFL